MKLNDPQLFRQQCTIDCVWKRAAILRRWFALIMEHQKDLAVLKTLEQGKPLAESRGKNA